MYTSHRATDGLGAGPSTAGIGGWEHRLALSLRRWQARKEGHLGPCGEVAAAPPLLGGWHVQEHHGTPGW